MDLYQFFIDVGERAAQSGERFGQAAFNHLTEVRPDLSEQVRGTDKDPFYADDPSDPRWKRFNLFLRQNWEKQPCA